MGVESADIKYTNAAKNGFFAWLATHYPAAHVFVECKNYGTEVGNPELDQLSGRFSPTRGQFGILVCRQFRDKARFQERCKYTAIDHRGFVIALDDSDLQSLVQLRGDEDIVFRFLKDRFDQLIM